MQNIQITLKSFGRIALPSFFLLMLLGCDRHPDVTKLKRNAWPTKVIDKCTSEYCRDFETPFGIYRINDPAGYPETKIHVENEILWNRVNSDPTHEESLKYISLHQNILNLDMLRAGCSQTVDYVCKKSGYSFNKNCREAFNFGQAELSKCETRQIPKWPRWKKPTPEKLVAITACGINEDEMREVFHLSHFKGEIDDAVQATFDTRCIAWTKNVR